MREGDVLSHSCLRVITFLSLYHQALLSLRSLRALGAVCSHELCVTLMHPPRGWRKVMAVQDPLGASRHFLVAVQLRHDAADGMRCVTVSWW